MKFVVIFGPQAVGKMTVGHELEKITELKLFHNHMTIELLAPYFNFSPEMWTLVSKFRQDIFEATATSGMYGMIFTYVWAFDIQDDWDYLDNVCKIFGDKGGEVYFVELEADLEERIERNKTPHRLEHKPTKRDIARSEHDLKQTMEHHRLNSFEGEIKRENYIRINNTKLNADEVAEIIKNRFAL
ncbi:shikimate kinase [Bacillus sp. FJAT-27264]|uniref:AAA family ATPase n=1 Tax=Paenibacillus sp. (strain DSM 101736 / FJAT-27264) TaxID=1850362 RepID=UPI000807A5FA|nr:AAA family ATPase [Bacillus sp. FJAT-27264]OBZ14351.1 shikimate kinase [Bacillus sp. FJAT-27264]